MDFQELQWPKLPKEQIWLQVLFTFILKTKKNSSTHFTKNVEKKSSARFLEGYDPDQPFKICLKKVWINYLKNRIENFKESVFMEQYYHSPYITLTQKKIAEDMRAPVHAIIIRGKDEGLLDNDIDTEMHFAAMIGFIREMAYEHVGGRYILNSERINTAFEINWRMIKV